jgi:hypothetical protein
MKTKDFVVTKRPRLAAITKHPKVDFADYERRLQAMQSTMQAIQQAYLAVAGVGRDRILRIGEVEIIVARRQERAQSQRKPDDQCDADHEDAIERQVEAADHDAAGHCGRWIDVEIVAAPDVERGLLEQEREADGEQDLPQRIEAQGRRNTPSPFRSRTSTGLRNSIPTSLKRKDQHGDERGVDAHPARHLRIVHGGANGGAQAGFSMISQMRSFLPIFSNPISLSVIIGSMLFTL